MSFARSSCLRFSLIAAGVSAALWPRRWPLGQQGQAPAAGAAQPQDETRRGHRLRSQHRARRHGRGGQRRLRQRRGSARAPDGARRGGARGRAGHGRRAALGQRQGEPVFLARLQPGPWHGFHGDLRRRAAELPFARPWAGLSRRQRHDAGDDRAHRLPQGHVSRRHRRFLDGGRRRHHDDRTPRRAVRFARERRERLGAARDGRRRRISTTARASPGSSSARPTTVRGSSRKVFSTRRSGASTGGRRISARWR